MKLEHGNIDFNSCLQDNDLTIEHLYFNEVQVKSLAEFIEGNPNIVSLTLVSPNIRTSTINELIRAINKSSITSLRINRDDAETCNIDLERLGPIELEIIAKIENLENLAMNHESVLKDQKMDALVTMNKLKKLDIYGNNIGPAGMIRFISDVLPKMKYLENLSIACTGINDECVKYIDDIVGRAANKLTDINISLNYLSPESVQDIFMMGKSHGIEFDLCSDYDDGTFYTMLQKIDDGKEDVEYIIKETIFLIARDHERGTQDQDEKYIRYILDKPEAFPFNVNSLLEKGKPLIDYYGHSPEMQAYLKGKIQQAKDKLERCLEDTSISNRSRSGPGCI